MVRQKEAEWHGRDNLRGFQSHFLISTIKFSALHGDIGGFCEWLESVGKQCMIFLRWRIISPSLLDFCVELMVAVPCTMAILSGCRRMTMPFFARGYWCMVRIVGKQYKYKSKQIMPCHFCALECHSLTKNSAAGISAKVLQ